MKTEEQILLKLEQLGIDAYDEYIEEDWDMLDCWIDALRWVLKQNEEIRQ